MTCSLRPSKRAGLSFLAAALLCVLAGPLWAGVDIVIVSNQIRSHYADFDKEVIDLSVDLKARTPEGEWIEKKMFLKGDRLRVDTTVSAPEMLSDPEQMAAMRTTLLYDGRQAWLVRPFADPERANIGEFTESQLFGRWWKLLTSHAAVRDQERVDDSDAFVIVPEAKTGSRYTKLWVEKDSWLLIKAEGTSESGARWVWRFRDFRPVSETYRLPFQIDLYENDLLVKSYTVSEMIANHSLPDHIFKIPTDLTRASQAS